MIDLDKKDIHTESVSTDDLSQVIKYQHRANDRLFDENLFLKDDAIRTQKELSSLRQEIEYIRSNPAWKAARFF